MTERSDGKYADPAVVPVAVASTGVTVRLSAAAPGAEIVVGVRLAADGEHVLVSLSSRPTRTRNSVGLDSLTRRERDVFELLGRGRSNAEIAEALCVSIGTTRVHVKHVYRKLGVHSRGELLEMQP